MTRFGIRLIIVSVIALCCASPASAESLDALQKKISEKLAGYKTLSFKSRSTSDLNISGMNIKSDSDQFVQVMHRGEKILSRIEMKSTTLQKMAGQEQKIVSNMLVVSDGDFNYVYNESADQKSATKIKLDLSKVSNPFDGRQLFTELQKNYTLKVLPDETVNGKPCYALEMIPKDPAAQAGIARTVSNYDKETAMQVKSVSYDKDGKVIATSITSDVKIDPTIPADRFVFKAPEGVTVQEIKM